VAVVLGCNNFRVIDLGVMTPCSKILETAKEHNADIIGLSGLITPSLDEMVFVAKEMEKQKMRTPLLIGGATTSKMHTAVKIAPQYSNTAIHVLDASRTVPICQSLMGRETAIDLGDEIKEEYAEMRDEFYAGLQDRVYLSLDKARDRKLHVDWNMPENIPHTPNLIGDKVIDNVSIEELVPYIDWNPFFQTWQLRGRYPNRGYPKIFNDQTVGEEAKKLHNDAMKMLEEIGRDKSLQMKGIVGFYPANSVGDDIEVYSDNSRSKTTHTFYTLRQQAEKDTDDPYLALSDFIAPKGSAKDYIGMFACSAFGLDGLSKKYLDQNDDYSNIMAAALADRLAEAMAELLHVQTRKEFWGYADNENLSQDDLLKVKYQGIRPAPGYPSQPDHTEKRTMWDLMDIEKKTGIQLTESLAMMPASSVSGLYFAGKCSQYFSVGKITSDQVKEYAERKKEPVEEVERWLAPTLSYEP